MTLRLPADSGTRLAQKFLQETEPPLAEPSAQHKEALEELLRQIAGQAATALASAREGKYSSTSQRRRCRHGRRRLPHAFYTRDEAGTPVTIEIQISAALAAAFATTRGSTARIRVTSRPTVAPAAAASYERLRDVVSMSSFALEAAACCCATCWRSAPE